MADKWPLTASINWSNPSSWNGGTLPVDGDDIYADGRTVTIDQHINLPNARLFTLARSGGTAGGQFVLSGAWNVTVAAITPGSTLCIGISANYTGTITCPSINPSATVSAAAISVTGGLEHNFYINGNFYAGNASGRIAMSVAGASSGTITLVNCTAHSLTPAIANCISNASGSGLLIQGTCNLVQTSTSGNSVLFAQTTGAYNLTGTIIAGGNATLATIASGGSLIFNCTNFAWSSPLNTANVMFSSSSSLPMFITMPPIEIHNNTSGPILMSTNTAGSNCRYIGDITAGIATIFQATVPGAKLEHFGTLVCNALGGATLNAATGSCIILDKVEAASNGNFITFFQGGGIRAKSTTALYIRDADNNVVSLIRDGGLVDLPIPANVREGISYNNGTQVGTYNAGNEIAQSVWEYTTRTITAGGLDAAGVRAAVGLASANLDSQFNSLGGTLVTIGSYIDTEVAAIKAKTDQFVFTVPNKVDSNAVVSVFTQQDVEQLRYRLGIDGTTAVPIAKGTLDLISLTVDEVPSVVVPSGPLVRADLDAVFGKDNIDIWSDLNNNQNAGEIAARVVWSFNLATAMVRGLLEGSTYKWADVEQHVVVKHLVVLQAGILLYGPRAVSDEEEKANPMRGHQKRFDELIKRVFTGNFSMVDKTKQCGTVPIVVE